MQSYATLTPTYTGRRGDPHAERDVAQNNFTLSGNLGSDAESTCSPEA